MLASECRLLLAPPNPAIVRVILQVEAALSGRKDDRPVLAADIDAEPGIIQYLRHFGSKKCFNWFTKMDTRVQEYFVLSLKAVSKVWLYSFEA